MNVLDSMFGHVTTKTFTVRVRINSILIQLRNTHWPIWLTIIALFAYNFSRDMYAQRKRVIIHTELAKALASWIRKNIRNVFKKSMIENQ